MRVFFRWLLHINICITNSGAPFPHFNILSFASSLFLRSSTSPPSDDVPKPQITVQPETSVTVLGSDVRLTCTAASSSSSPMTFAWRKDQELLRHAEMENYHHHAPGAAGGVMEYTTILHLRHVTFAHEGRYQCIITNHFGSTYSTKARLIVNGSFLFFNVIEANIVFQQLNY